MDNFRIIYKILKVLEQAMDLDEFNPEEISAERLGISENRWRAIMEMLSESGYVKGVSVIKSIGGSSLRLRSDFGITLKGLEYLDDNTFMKKAANIAKGIKESIPGL